MKACFQVSFKTFLIITVFALVACSGDNDETGNAATIRDGNINSPSGTAHNANGDSPASTPTPIVTPFLIGTPQGGERVKKDVPPEPAPTQASVAETDSPLDADGDGKYTFEELVQAVDALYPTYEWPSNYRTTPELLLSGFAPMAEQDARWGVPYEYTLVGGAHQCAWELAWLDAYGDGDTALMDESLHQLRTVALARPTLHPSAIEMFDEVYDQAALGDPTMIQQIVKNNCEDIEFITPTPIAFSIVSTPQRDVGHFSSQVFESRISLF